MEIIGNPWACNILRDRGDDSFQKLRERLRTGHEFLCFNGVPIGKTWIFSILAWCQTFEQLNISKQLLSRVLRSSSILWLLSPKTSTCTSFICFIHFSVDQDLGSFRCSHGGLRIHGWCVHPPYGEPLGPAHWAASRMCAAPRRGRTSRCWDHCSAAASARAGGQRCWGSWISCKVG